MVESYIVINGIMAQSLFRDLRVRVADLWGGIEGRTAVDHNNRPSLLNN